MSEREMRRTEAFGRVASGSLDLKQACEMLEVSYRQGNWLWSQYRSGERQGCSTACAGGVPTMGTVRSIGLRF